MINIRKVKIFLQSKNRVGLYLRLVIRLYYNKSFTPNDLIFRGQIKLILINMYVYVYTNGRYLVGTR